MQRSSIIATVVAAGGILIAGSVASVAVINAASSSQPDSQTIQLVAEGSSASPSAEPTVEASPASTTAAAELPTMEASKLPELPQVVEQPAAQQVAVAAAPAAKPASKPAKSKGADDSKPSQSAEPQYTVSADQARSAVLKAGEGDKVISVSKENHQGVSTWAVRFSRPNGEVLTGYVDREDGAIIAWVVNQEAQTPAQSTPKATYSDDDESDDHESEDSSDHESEDHSGSDHESGGDDD